MNDRVDNLAALRANEEEVVRMVKSLRAIAHPLRLKILCVLNVVFEASVQEIVDVVGTTQSNVSQHLSTLRECRILDCRRDANVVRYFIHDKQTARLADAIGETFCERCDQSSG